MSDPHQPASTPHPRGFAYFCEETLRYTGGLRAWLFFGPYLLGAIGLEPAQGGKSVHGFSPWLVLVAWLLIFPPVWRSFLLATGLWRKRAVPQPIQRAAPPLPRSAADLA